MSIIYLLSLYIVLYLCLSFFIYQHIYTTYVCHIYRTISCFNIPFSLPTFLPGYTKTVVPRETRHQANLWKCRRHSLHSPHLHFFFSSSCSFFCRCLADDAIDIVSSCTVSRYIYISRPLGLAKKLAVTVCESVCVCVCICACVWVTRFADDEWVASWHCWLRLSSAQARLGFGLRSL